MTKRFMSSKLKFCFDVSISSALFYIHVIIISMLQGSLICATYFSRINLSCNKETNDASCKNVFESNQTDFTAIQDIAFNIDNRRPVNCG